MAKPAARMTFWRVIAVCAISVAAAVGAWRIALSGIDARLDRSLILTLRALETEIDRFRYLPAVVGQDARIRAVIGTPDAPGADLAANRYLAEVLELSGADQLYLMDGQGVTLAASNWDSPASFVGHDYSFRPYFRDAIATGQGAFYAIGVTTGVPGYFLSARIGGRGGPPGVVVVKVDLDPLQQAWAQAGQAVAVADPDGVVFLSGNPDWLYHPLHPLAPEARARLADLKTYPGRDPAKQGPLMQGSAAWMFDASGARLRSQTAAFGEGWTVVAAAPVQPAMLSALIAGVTAALASVLGLALAKTQAQRRQLVALRLRQSEMLERKVAERTRALGREIEARRQTEAELRAAQEGLIHSEKMAALGRMSAAIVHEVSQPLAAMEATLAAAEMGAARSTEKTVARIATARNLIRRMQRTIKHLKSFSRKDTADLERIEIGAVAASALELVAPRARALGIKPRVVVPDGPLFANAGRVRLEQVLVNLLLNALDAVEGQPAPEVELRLEGAENELNLSVRDNGPGIAPEDVPRVTEPFFSTKDDGAGLGLGLAISQAILSEIGGRLDTRSTPGEGTQMIVTLTRVREKEPV